MSRDYRIAFPITKDDANNLPVVAQALYIGAPGTLKVDCLGIPGNPTGANTTVTFPNVAVGELRLAVTKVYLTGTSANQIIGMK